MKDLFGNEVSAVAPSKRRKDLAHAAPPGTGPEGETCGTCANVCAKEFARWAKGKTRYRHYFKCRLCRCSCGPATDIRLKHKACAFWARKESEK